MKKVAGFILLIAISIAGAKAQSQHTGIIEGKIITADNKPAEGVTILLKNLSRNAVADNNGVFKIKNVLPGSQTIVVSLVGYKDAEQDVNVENGKTSKVEIKLALSDKQLNEVVVVANKNNFKTNRLSNSLRLQTPILEVPQNIQVITGKLINDQQIFDMLEGVTRNVSGASRVEHWDNYARITMRGSNVGAFRNGMNVSTTWGPLTEDMSMVERIEFVKGPAGFMLANGDPSGFYNIVTKKPSGRTKGEASISLGSFDLYRAALDLDGKLTKDGKLLYRLNVMGQQKGSQRPYDFNNRYTIAPVLKYLVDDKTSLTLEYTQQFSQVNIIGSNYLFSKKGYAGLPRNFTNAEPNLPPTNMNERSVLAIIEHKINDNWKFTAQAMYMNYQQQGMSMWLAYPNGFVPGNDSLINRSISSWDVLGLTKIGQLFLNGEVATGKVVHKILAGVDMSNKDYYHDWLQSATLGTTPFDIYKPVYGVSPLSNEFDRSKSLRERGVHYYNAYTGIYLQDELNFLDNRLRVTLAGRYTTLKTGDVYSGSFQKSRFTPRIGLSYSIDKNTAVYFVSDQSFIENYGHDWKGKSFSPLVGSNLEVGFKKDWMNGKWNMGVSVYQITRNNVVTIDPDTSHRDHVTGQLASMESGQQKTKGIEVDIKGKILPNLDVVINYAYTEAKTTKDSDPKVIGNQVAGSTRHIQNSWLNYRFDHGTLNGFGISLGYQYQAKRSPWYVFDNSKNSLPDYFRLDGSLSYIKDKMTFNVVVNNILNKYLFSGAPYADYYYWQAEPGTNVRFTVGYKF